MANEKETQVFDQSDLDSLMAEIQKAETDSGGEAAEGQAEEAGSDGGDATEAAVLPDASPPEKAGAAEGDAPVEAAGGQALEQKDLDGLIEELNQDVADPPEASGPESDPADMDNAATDTPNTAGTPPAEDVAPEGDAAAASDENETVTIDQSELEALIKELQEGVETPEVVSKPGTAAKTTAPKPESPAQQETAKPERKGATQAATEQASPGDTVRQE